MQFAAAPYKRRKPSLTPMIDVVFLLLVFFMLASQFGLDQVIRLPLAGSSTAGEYTGPPRLVTVTENGLSLNGVALELGALSTEIGVLTESPKDTIILRGQGAASTQNIIDVLAHLQAAGFETVVLVD